ncbi:MAG TPA: hypothetical protein DCE81_11395 [Cytophagales bacterium]|nr:hypothetical protein [Cytophagales bacterium]
MHLHLIQGEFNRADAIELITRMVHVKIKYHESKIMSDSNEEDIKHREARIKSLQKELFELRKFLEASKENVNIDANVTIAL